MNRKLDSIIVNWNRGAKKKKNQIGGAERQNCGRACIAIIGMGQVILHRPCILILLVMILMSMEPPNFYMPPISSIAVKERHEKNKLLLENKQIN